MGLRAEADAPFVGFLFCTIHFWFWRFRFGLLGCFTGRSSVGRCIVRPSNRARCLRLFEFHFHRTTSLPSLVVRHFISHLLTQSALRPILPTSFFSFVRYFVLAFVLPFIRSSFHPFIRPRSAARQPLSPHRHICRSRAFVLNVCGDWVSVFDRGIVVFGRLRTAFWFGPDHIGFRFARFGSRLRLFLHSAIGRSSSFLPYSFDVSFPLTVTRLSVYVYSLVVDSTILDTLPFFLSFLLFVSSSPFLSPLYPVISHPVTTFADIYLHRTAQPTPPAKSPP